MRIVIRNLHPSTSTELIKSELKLRLYEVVWQVTQVIHRISKFPLQLFFVDFERFLPSKVYWFVCKIIAYKFRCPSRRPYKPWPASRPTTWKPLESLRRGDANGWIKYCVCNRIIYRFTYLFVILLVRIVTEF